MDNSQKLVAISLEEDDVSRVTFEMYHITNGITHSAVEVGFSMTYTKECFDLMLNNLYEKKQYSIVEVKDLNGKIFKKILWNIKDSWFCIKTKAFADIMKEYAIDNFAEIYFTF